MPDGRPWPRISIVTPSLNQGRFIEETILSVLHQEYPAVEHIVMDGGSTDETRRILARYQGRLAFAASEKDKGQSEAINKGFARATRRDHDLAQCRRHAGPGGAGGRGARLCDQRGGSGGGDLRHP